MGKTKTAFISGVEEEVKKPSYDKAAKEAKRQAKEAVFTKAPHEKESNKKVHIPGLKGGQRIAAIEAPVIEATESKQASAQDTKPSEKKKLKAPKVRGKKYQQMRASVDKNKLYTIPEAIELVKKTSYSKFDGTVEVHLVVKKVGLSANVALPHSGGKSKKVEVASEGTITKLASGKIDFDVLLATADMMPKLVAFAKLLGPRGLMPNPKNGTLIKSVKDADKFSAAILRLKTEKDAPLIHTVIGKVSQDSKELTDNLEVLIVGLGDKQIVRAYLKASMGPAIKLQVS